MNFIVGQKYDIVSRVGKNAYKSFWLATVARNDGENVSLTWKTSKDFAHPDKDNMIIKNESIKKADIIYATRLI